MIPSDTIIAMNEYIDQFIEPIDWSTIDDYDLLTFLPPWKVNTPDWIKNLPPANYRRNPNCFREQLEIFHHHGIFFSDESDIV